MEPGFWDDQARAQALLQRVGSVRSEIKELQLLRSLAGDLEIAVQLSEVSPCALCGPKLRQCEGGSSLPVLVMN